MSSIDNQRWQKALLEPSASVMNAVKIINESAMKTALVVDEGGRLMGILTDGDIRRAILEGRSLEDKVTTILNRNPIIGRVGSSRHERVNMMQSKQLISLPILDDSDRIVGLDLLADILTGEKKDNPIFLMAGGAGTRLKPLTDSCPKPLLHVGGKPILENIIERFSELGFQNIYLSVHYLKHQIHEHFEDGSKWNVNIKYLVEDQPLGTAGALSLLPESTRDLPMIVMNADLLTKVNFDQLLEFHAESNAVATVAVREYDFQVPYGVLKHKKGRVTEIVEKPVHQFFVNAGMYVLDPVVFRSVPKNQYLDMPNLLNRFIVESQSVAMFPLHEYWLDIGQLNDFERAQRDFAELSI